MPRSKPASASLLTVALTVSSPLALMVARSDSAAWGIAGGIWLFAGGVACIIELLRQPDRAAQ